MDYILEEINKAGADGVDVVPISERIVEGKYDFKIIDSYTKEEWIKEVGSYLNPKCKIHSYPKCNLLYWKMIDGKKVYCK